MPSEMIPEDDRLALARALRNVQGEAGSGNPDEVRDDIAKLFDDEVEEQAAEKPARRLPRFRLLHVLLVLLAIGSVALAVPLALDFFGGDDGEVQMIQAEPQPEKVRPEEPGGLEVPYQDKLVMNQGGTAAEEATVERLLPPPESPQPVIAEPPEPMMQGEGEGADVPGMVMPEPMAPDPQVATGPTGAEEAPALPRATRGGETSPSAASSFAPGVTSAADPSAGPKMITLPEVAPTAEAPTTVTEVETAQQAQPTATATQTPTQTPNLAAATDGFFIQLGSLTNEEAVPVEWSRLQKAFPDLLGDMNLVVQSVTLEDRGTFHRVQTGPFPNRGTAEDMCALVKAGNQACLVVKR